MAGNKFKSKHSGKVIDDAIDYILQQKELGTSQIVESTPETPIELDNLTNEEGKFTIYYFTGGASGSESGKPIDVEVYKDSNDNTVQRYTQNGVTMERTQDAETEQWTPWTPVSDVIQVEEDQQVTVTKDTIVLRKVNNIDSIISSTE